MSEPRKPAGRRKPIAGEEHLTTRKGSPFWWLDFSIDGERFRESTGTAGFEQAAALAAQRYATEWDRIKRGVVPARGCSVEEACLRWWEEVGQHSTYGKTGQRYQLPKLRRFLGPRTPLSELDNGKVADLVLQLRGDGAGPATVNRYLSTLNIICERAREVWGVAVGTWQKAKHTLREPEGREVFLSHDQARQVMAAAIPHLQPFLALEFLTALRKGNVAGLMWENVSLEMRRMVLQQKGDRRLSVPLDEVAISLLARLQPDPALRQGPVFRYGNPAVPCPCSACTQPGMKLIGRQFVNPKRSVATAFRNAGVPPGTRFHDLRHTVASWLLAETRNLKVVQQALGHSQITTTSRYAHLMGDEVAQGHRATAARLFESNQPAAPEALPAPKKGVA